MPITSKSSGLFASVIKLVTPIMQLFVADDVSRRDFQMLFVGALRVIPLKPSVRFMEHWQSVQSQIRRLIRLCSVFLQNVLFKFE